MIDVFYLIQVRQQDLNPDRVFGVSISDVAIMDRCDVFCIAPMWIDKIIAMFM